MSEPFTQCISALRLMFRSAKRQTCLTISNINKSKKRDDLEMCIWTQKSVSSGARTLSAVSWNLTPFALASTQSPLYDYFANYLHNTLIITQVTNSFVPNESAQTYCDLRGLSPSSLLVCSCPFLSDLPAFYARSALKVATVIGDVVQIITSMIFLIFKYF